MTDENMKCHDDGLSPLIVRSIIESMALGLMVIDPDGTIVIANQALGQILGISQDTMLSKGWGQLFIANEQNLDFNQVFIDVIWNEQQNLQRTVPYERPDGTRRTVAMTTSYLKAEGSMEGIVLLVQDVTEREQLLQREREMMQDMNELQTERSEGLNKLALSVAHQIRNPMMTIGGFTKLLQKHEDMAKEEEEYLGIIRDELRKLEGLVSAVVEYASMGAPEINELRARSVLETALTKLSRRKAVSGMSFDPAVVEIDCGNCSFQGDQEMLARALEELLANALEAIWHPTEYGMRRVGGVTMSVRHGNGQVELVVSDTGAGIKNEFLPYIFDPFFTTRANRTGMGLSLAKRIALEHQGMLSVDSEIGTGTRAMLRIPRGEETGEEG